ncbi:hypothetical protein ACFXAF_06110 [Kitasatospora sp. NPDC059463]|uniref:hypothetical protein n=1 Tax=unclassified Kitasatospora TaxID=2633591 RepID=UPI0036795D3B
MSRIRTAAAVTALGALLFAGAGAAHADDGAGGQSTTSTVSNTGSGNVLGNVVGNAVGTQQTATGSGAGNQSNALATAGNTGSVSVLQENGNLPAPVAPPAGD